MWMGVECPCPPVQNDIVTPRHLLSSSVSSKIANETDSNCSFFSIPTGRNNSDPRFFLRTGIFYGLILFLPFTLIFVGESSHATAIYTNIVLSIDCLIKFTGFSLINDCDDDGLIMILFNDVLTLVVLSHSRKKHDNHVFPMNKTLLSGFLP